MRVIYGVLGAAVLFLLLAIFIQQRQIHSLTVDRDNWKQSAWTYDAAWKSWAASYWKSESLRGQEDGQARNGAQSDSDTCDARIAAARSSASAITRIVTVEATCEAGSSPTRRLVSSRELCVALTPAACSGR